MACVEKRDLTVKVKEFLGRLTKRDWTTILVDDELEGERLGFTKSGLRALAGDVVRAQELAGLGIEVVPDDTGTLKTVRALRDLLWKKIPEEKKC